MMNASHTDQIALAASVLCGGGLVVFPTETVYGLGADALNASAVELVFAVKGRPARNPLIVHVADQAMAETIVSEWPDQARTLAARFWPGPLTIVVARAMNVPDVVTGGGSTVGVRCPDHPVALDLIRAFGGPIVGPSANRSGMVSPTTAAHVREDFSAELDRGELMLLDGGPCRRGIESTVVSVIADSVKILRRGLITPEEIATTLGTRVDVVEATNRNDDAVLPSPGMMAKHYAPRTRAVLFDAEEWPEILDGVPGFAVVLTHERGRVVPAPHVLIRMPLDAAGYAARLYEALHEADGSGAALIAIEGPRAPGGVWDAIRDRLHRACAE